MASAGVRSAPSVLLVPLEDALHWSRATISSAVGINILVYGLISPFAAALMERFGVRRVVMSALTVVGTGAFLTQFVNAPWQLIALWGFVVGVGTGSMAVVFVATVANRWFIAKKGLVVGILSAGQATGQLIFLPLLSSLAVNVGWQSVSMVIAIAMWTMVPLIYFLLKESPAHLGLKPLGAPNDYVEKALVKQNAAKQAWSTLRESTHKKDFWLLFGSFMVCGLSTNGLVGTHFIAAAHDHGMSEVTAASLLALIGVFDVIGTITSGVLTDKIDPRRLLFFYYFLRGVSLFLLPMILFNSIHTSTMAFVLFYGLDWVATVPPTIMLCRNVLGVERGAIVYGWVFAAHQIGASIAAYGAALLRVQFGNYSLAFYIAGVACVITSYFVLQISDPAKNQLQKKA